MKFAPSTIALCAVLAAPLAVAAPDMRAPTAAEEKSFDEWQRRHIPDAPAGKPVFSVTRPDGKAAWTITATRDSPPQHELRPLCRMTRSQFRYAGGGWAEAVPARQFAWLQRGACSVPPQPVELLQPMPGTKIIPLMEQHAPLLQSARIMLSGNTSCARQRSYRFALTAIAPGTQGPGPGLTAGLVFTSDHNTQATVWVRRAGLGFNAWNVSCP